MTAGRQLHIGAFINAAGHHSAAWRHPEAQADAGMNLDHLAQLARTAERGKLDFVFFAFINFVLTVDALGLV